MLLTLVGAALTAFARAEINAGTNWALQPIAKHLPWNRKSDATSPVALQSVFTLVQLFLLDANGSCARYEKTTSFIVNRKTATYREAVTAEHCAAGFATMRGTITETVVERGFYVSTIDLGNTIGEGERLTNVYSADLFNSFVRPQEHWTQEFAYPTEHLTLQVHFPEERPPKSVRSIVLDGDLEKSANQTARILDLYGSKSIVWDVDDPDLHRALKLEWIW